MAAAPTIIVKIEGADTLAEVISKLERLIELTEALGDVTEKVHSAARRGSEDGTRRLCDPVAD